jgi:Rrf2 family protein
MIDLAETYGPEQSPVMMGDIAKRQDVSRKYLHALLTSLKQAGLVRSIRGAKGGYALARNPSDITVSQIVKALEGELSIVECLHDAVPCDRGDTCRSRPVWSELNDAISSFLDRMTLSKLIGPTDCLGKESRL